MAWYDIIANDKPRNSRRSIGKIKGDPMKIHKTKAAAILSLGIALLISNASFAATTTVQFQPGKFSTSTISIEPFNNGDPVQLTGSDQRIETTIDDFSIVDARGNNKGWILRISATPFDSGSGETLHEGALTLSGAVVNAVGNSDRFDGDCTVKNDIALSGIPQNFIVVPVSQGKGTYTVSGAGLSLDVWPKEALAGTFTSTITFDLVTNVSE
jgi:hypothetical protein